MLKFNSSKLTIKLKYLYLLKGPFAINKITHILSNLRLGLAYIYTRNWVYNDLWRNNNFIIINGDLTYILGEVYNRGTPYIKPPKYLYN